MLKKISSITLLILSTLFFIGCSKDAIDEWNNTVSGVNPNSKINLKINDTNYQEYTDDNNHAYWNIYNNGNGTNNYSIKSYINVIGINVVAFPKTIEINFSGTKLENGQIINGNATGFNFTIYGSGLDTSEYHFVNGTSTGQIKITNFNGVTMSGEFSFTRIVKFVEYPQIGVDYQNNTINGTFNSVVKYN
jgi:hypothetical protein